MPNALSGRLCTQNENGAVNGSERIPFDGTEWKCYHFYGAYCACTVHVHVCVCVLCVYQLLFEVVHCNTS